MVPKSQCEDLKRHVATWLAFWRQAAWHPAGFLAAGCLAPSLAASQAAGWLAALAAWLAALRQPVASILRDFGTVRGCSRLPQSFC